MERGPFQYQRESASRQRTTEQRQCFYFDKRLVLAVDSVEMRGSWSL